MNGDQGLQALAALCGGEAAVGTDNSSIASGGSNQPQDGLNITNSGQQHQQGGRPPIEGITSQQWQQAVAAAAALHAQGAQQQAAPTPGAAPVPPVGLTAQSLALLQAAGLQPAPAASNPQQHAQPNAALAAMQQLAYFRAVANMGQQNPSGNPQQQQNQHHNFSPLLHSNPQVMALALAGQTHQLQQHFGDAAGRQQVLPPAAAPSGGGATSQPESSAANSMPPPSTSGQGGVSLPSTLSTAGINHGNNNGSSNNNPHRHAAIAPLPRSSSAASSRGGRDSGSNSDDGMSSHNGGGGIVVQDKKLQKRAANRRSAQLSRKRKKQFIEELKDENDELRRKEQILRSIPDLIVVFDSTGKLWFVSQSVSRFMSMTAKELEGSSFWDRLCEDSVRLLKAAFMDSLAARTDDSDSAPLGSGIWELRLVDKDGSYKVVTLNGVVHFSGDRPECVCSIRPRDDPSMMPPAKRKQKQTAKAGSGDEKSAVRNGDGSDGTATTEATTNDSSNSNGSVHFQQMIRAKPQQSVTSNSSSSSSARINNKVKAGKRREAARISDGDSGSTDESGSSDEIEAAD